MQPRGAQVAVDEQRAHAERREPARDPERETRAAFAARGADHRQQPAAAEPVHAQLLGLGGLRLGPQRPGRQQRLAERGDEVAFTLHEAPHENSFIVLSPGRDTNPASHWAPSIDGLCAVLTFPAFCWLDSSCPPPSPPSPSRPSTPCPTRAAVASSPTRPMRSTPTSCSSKRARC